MRNTPATHIRECKSLIWREGVSDVKAYGDVLPKWVTFSAKSLEMGSILIKKSQEEGPISQKLWKIVKSAILKIEKPLEMGPHLQKFWKKLLNQLFFEGGMSLDMGRGFRPRAAHPVKK